DQRVDGRLGLGPVVGQLPQGGEADAVVLVLEVLQEGRERFLRLGFGLRPALLGADDEADAYPCQGHQGEPDHKSPSHGRGSFRGSRLAGSPRSAPSDKLPACPAESPYGGEVGRISSYSERSSALPSFAGMMRRSSSISSRVKVLRILVTNCP